MQLDKKTLGRMAKEMGFVRDTFEKVCRLADVLKFIVEDELLAKSIALKGGTAINLTIFDLPRLSVDIDLDYCKSNEREEMLADREIITDKISKYMTANEYTLSPKSKTYHAVDHIGKVSAQKIKRDLNPVLRKGEKFNLDAVQKEVKDYLASIMMPTEEEENFWRAFAERNYCPELVFGESQELQNILGHPMALWKCRHR